MIEQNNPSGKSSESRRRWSWYRILLALIPASIPFAYFYLTGKETWSPSDFAVVCGLFIAYWMIVMVIVGRMLRSRQALQAARLASPLIEVPLSADLRTRLSRFAASKRQKLAVAAFELLDQEIPRFDQDEERDRARRDNEHLRQQAGQGAFLVAVTTEILKRLLLLSGAYEEDRKFWRAQISETAARIVSDALEHRMPGAEQLTEQTT
ncbi:MAG TPA: hypothetical protein VKE91_10280 [Blastocatellia bacterium]|nr:hypothetical protein [Blastocatellia bacterium]